MPLLPQPLQVVGRQDEHAVEPLPEGEGPVGQVLLAEERPRQHQLVVLIPVPRKVVVSECLACEVVEVLLAEVSAARRLPLHVECVAHLRPRHLVGDDRGGTVPLRTDSEYLQYAQ